MRYGDVLVLFRNRSDCFLNYVRSAPLISCDKLDLQCMKHYIALYLVVFEILYARKNQNLCDALP